MTFFIGISVIAFNKISIEKNNVIIDDNVIKYVSYVNNKQYDELESLYFSKGEKHTTEYMNLLREKINKIGFKGSKIDTIYPALINGNLAVVNVSFKSDFFYQNNNKSVFETNTFILIKKGDNWFFALPEDLKPYKEEYISNLIDVYNKQLKDQNILK